MTTERVIEILDQVDATDRRDRINATDAELEELCSLGWLYMQHNDGPSRHLPGKKYIVVTRY